ncbi:hypothetical protein MCOR25_006341 [Pyricularia grisea]|nr:hypothetical protein MCOR25_006341 [Pyricularia grisea]
MAQGRNDQNLQSMQSKGGLLSPSSVEQQPLPLLMSPLPVEQPHMPLLPPSNTGWSQSYYQATLIDQTLDGNSMYSPGFNPIMTPQDAEVMSCLSSDWGSYDLAGVLPPDENPDDQQVVWSLPSPSPSSLQDQQPCHNPLQAVSPQQEMYHPTSEPQQQGLHSLPEQFLAPDPSPYSPPLSSQDYQTAQTTFGDSHVSNVTSLSSHLFELMYLCQAQSGPETSSASSSTSTPAGGCRQQQQQQYRPNVCLSGILTCIQRLFSLLAPYVSSWDGRQGFLSGVTSALIDGPTNLLILSCYAKIFEAFRQLMSGVYHRLLSGQTTTNLYELKIDDVAIDGDGHLEILILIQIITHKLNTLGAVLGVPEKHRVGVGDELQYTGASGATATTNNTTVLKANGMVGGHGAVEPYWEMAPLDDLISGSAGSKHVFGEEGSSPMESAAAAFSEELRLIKDLLDHKGRMI